MILFINIYIYWDRGCHIKNWGWANRPMVIWLERDKAFNYKTLLEAIIIRRCQFCCCGCAGWLEDANSVVVNVDHLSFFAWLEPIYIGNDDLCLVPSVCFFYLFVFLFYCLRKKNKKLAVVYQLYYSIGYSCWYIDLQISLLIY